MAKTKSSWVIYAVCGLCLAAGVAFVAKDMTKRFGSMKVAASEASSLKPGAEAKIVVETMAGGSGEWTARLLSGDGNSPYHVTNTELRVTIPEDITFIMGSPKDLKPDGIYQVTGIVDKPGHVRSSRVVVLTGWVKVAP
jgi:hypothetical protein